MSRSADRFRIFLLEIISIDWNERQFFQSGANGILLAEMIGASKQKKFGLKQFIILTCSCLILSQIFTLQLGFKSWKKFDDYI